MITNNTQPSKGYFSIVQYCPDMARAEAANIGVVLVCPDRAFQQAVVSNDNARVRHFFGTQGHDWKEINIYKTAVVERVKAEGFQTLVEFEKYVSSRANLVTMTRPRFVKVRDPKADLQRLYDELVGGRSRATRRTGFRKSVRSRLMRANLGDKLKEDISVTVPVIERQLNIPFAYRNGRVNLIRPVPFAAKDSDSVITTACKYAVEGRSLFESPHPQLGELRLVIVGRFRSKKLVDPVHKIFEKHEVKLYHDTELGELIHEIQVSGKQWDHTKE